MGCSPFSNANLSASVGSGSGISNLRRKAKWEKIFCCSYRNEDFKYSRKDTLTNKQTSFPPFMWKVKLLIKITTYYKKLSFSYIVLNTYILIIFFYILIFIKSLISSTDQHRKGQWKRSKKTINKEYDLFKNITEIPYLILCL